MNKFLLHSLENIGSSFVFGTTSRLIYKSIIEYPDLFTIKECMKSGAEMSKYTLVHSINSFLLNKIGMDGIILSLSSVFLTSFYIGMRNGVKFATKNGMSGIMSTLLKDLIKLY